jgi:hypothetical protein
MENSRCSGKVNKHKRNGVRGKGERTERKNFEIRSKLDSLYENHIC